MLATNPLVILGDFNLSDINQNTLSGNSLLAHSFCEFVIKLNLLQLIESSTHIHGSILDLLLTNTDDIIQHVVVLPHNISPIQSNHYLITFTISVSLHLMSNGVPHYIYDYYKANFDGLDACIHNSNILNCLASQDMELV